VSYEVRGGEWGWEDRMQPGFSPLPGTGPAWDGHGDPPGWLPDNPGAPVAHGCGCASCEASQDDPAVDPESIGSNPYDALRRLNASPHDPLTAREEARKAAVAELADEANRDGRAAGLELRRSRNPDGGNLSGSAARQIVRMTEFRAVSW